MSDKLLFTGAEWTPKLLDKTWEVIDDLGKNWLGLEYNPPQFEIVTAQQMISNICSHGMPQYYNHWSFGKKFIKEQRKYQKGMSGTIFELVINTDPSIAYLMETNTMSMMALVIAHASVGHASVFKQNYLFKEWTVPDFTVEYIKYASKYIKQCEEKYGIEAVEYILDRAHALAYHSIDRYKKNRSRKKDGSKLTRMAKKEEELYDILKESIPGYKEYKKSIKFGHLIENEEFSSSKYNLPEDNILYFLEKHSLVLKTWQKEILRIVRVLSQSFFPQMEIHLLHEGWASFIHYEIMTKLYDDGYIAEAAYFEFLSNHTAVVNQPEVPYGNSYINPYKLGYEMFKDLKRICQEPTEEDKKWFPDIVNTDWKETLKDIMINYKDETFILDFLSPKLIRDFGFYIYQEEDGDYNRIAAAFHIIPPYGNGSYVVLGTHDDDDIHNIRLHLSKMYGLSEIRIPHIEINQVYMKTDRSIVLKETSGIDMELDRNQLEKTLEYIHDLWGYPVSFMAKYEDNKYTEIARIK